MRSTLIATPAALQQVADGHLEAVVSAEVVQEILRRFPRGDRDVGVRMARSVLDLLGTLVSVERSVLADAVARFRGSAGVSARDVLHAAEHVGVEAHRFTGLILELQVRVQLHSGHVGASGTIGTVGPPTRAAAATHRPPTGIVRWSLASMGAVWAPASRRAAQDVHAD